MKKIEAYAIKKHDRYWVIAVDHSVGMEVFKEDPAQEVRVLDMVFRDGIYHRVSDDFVVSEENNHTGFQHAALMSRFLGRDVYSQGYLEKMGLIGGLS